MTATFPRQLTYLFDIRESTRPLDTWQPEMSPWMSPNDPLSRFEWILRPSNPKYSISVGLLLLLYCHCIYNKINFKLDYLNEVKSKIFIFFESIWLCLHNSSKDENIKHCRPTIQKDRIRKRIWWKVKKLVRYHRIFEDSCSSRDGLKLIASREREREH